MKSERRHELQENELADWLETSIARVTPHLKTIGGLALAIAVCVGAYAIWKNRAAGDQRAAWDSFYAAANGKDANEEMLRLADARPTDAAGLWARLYVADASLADGVQNLFSNRTVAKPKLKEAVAAYGLVATNAAGKYDALVPRALYGQAKAYEALGEKSDLDAALKLYKQIQEEYPDSALATDSAARVAALEKPSSKEFYDWFAKAQPITPATTEGGTPGIGPSFDDASVPAPPTDTTVDPNFDPFKQPAPSTTPPETSGIPDSSQPASDAP